MGNLTLWWDTGQTSKFYMRDWQWEILLYGGIRGKQVSFISRDWQWEILLYGGIRGKQVSFISRDDVPNV